MALIVSHDRSAWAPFVQETFPFVAYEAGFADICLSPETAFEVLDGDDNPYAGRERVHADLLSDKHKLDRYLLPMLLRADVWCEAELRSRLEQKHKARLERLAITGASDHLPSFRMPDRPEWAKKSAWSPSG